jgi:aryl-alcohol dehydrogenase-like predicted oxidoreductase
LGRNVPFAYNHLNLISREEEREAWLLQKDIYTVPIIGATKVRHIEDACASLDFRLTDDEIAYLEEPYVSYKATRAL